MEDYYDATLGRKQSSSGGQNSGPSKHRRSLFTYFPNRLRSHYAGRVMQGFPQNPRLSGSWLAVTFEKETRRLVSWSAMSIELTILDAGSL
jgi:hypothetical protein